MRKRSRSVVSATGAGAIAIGGAATNCHFITNVHSNATRDPIASARLIRLPFLPLSEKFTGRRTLLSQLTVALAKAKKTTVSQPIVLFSDGGVGKSTLAIELAWRLYENKRFDYVFLLNATTSGALDNSIAELCDPAIQVGEEKSPARIIARRDAVLRWLQIPEKGGRTLIIFDSADSQKACEAVRFLLPKMPHCAKLITSRSSVWDDAVAYELRVFNPEESRQFLSNSLGPNYPETRETRMALEEIARAVDHLPLALEIVGSYIRKKRLPLGDWLKEWRRDPAAVISHEDPARVRYGRGKGGYPSSLAYVWKQSIAELSDGARKYLNMLTLMLAPRPAVFPFGKVRAQWTGTTELVAELADASLVAWHTNTDELSMHRILQLVTRLQQDDGDTAASLLVATLVVNSILPKPEWDEGNWRLWEQLTPHIDSLLDHLENPKNKSVRAPDILNQYGLWLSNRAEYGTAELLFRKAIALAELSEESDTAQMGAYLNNLGKVLHETNRLSEAEALYRRALIITEKTCGREDPEVAIRLSNLAALLMITQRATEAEPLLRRALAIDEKHFGAENTRVARDLNNLAAVMRSANRLEEAEDLLRRALNINTTSLSPNHPDLAASINNLGELLMARGRVEEAAPLLRNALHIIQDSLGVEHPTFATSLHNVATTLRSVGHVDQAESLLREGISVTEKSLGADHINVARDLTLLCEILRTEGRLEEAETAARRALKIDERSLGSSHSSVARDLNALAAVLRDARQTETAIALLRRALVIDGSNSGADHPDTAITVFNLAEALGTTEQNTESEALYRRALTTFESDSAQDMRNVAMCLDGLGYLLGREKRFDEAESLLRRSLLLSTQQQGSNPREIARKQNNLGDLLWTAGRLPEGEPLIREALLILQRLRLLTGKEHPEYEGIFANYFGALRELGMTENEALKKIEDTLLEDVKRLAERLTTATSKLNQQEAGS